MKKLEGAEEKTAMGYILQAAEIAKNSTCERAKCGSVIVKNSRIIGKGFNSPAGNKEEQRKCSFDKSTYHQKVTDRTCCVHAEQRAIMDALKTNPEQIKDSVLYFARINETGTIEMSGKPYCTICSKMTLDSGIAEFVLLHKDGVFSYTTDEYNLLSYEYK